MNAKVTSQNPPEQTQRLGQDNDLGALASMGARPESKGPFAAIASRCRELLARMELGLWFF
jgi:hypothetical protein